MDLEILEMRQAPSFVYAEAAIVAEAPSAAIDFANIKRLVFKTTLKVYLHAADGSTFKETFSLEANTDLTVVRDLVLRSMKAEGWDATASGATGIVVSNHKGAALDKIGVFLVDYADEFQPGLSCSSGVSVVKQ